MLAAVTTAPRRFRRTRALATAAVTLVALAGLTVGAGPAAADWRPLGNPDFGPVASGDPAAPARCAPVTDRVFTGTVTGADGLLPNVTIGFDMKDAAGNPISLVDGCDPHGEYSTVVQLNHWVSERGAPAGTEMTDWQGHDGGPVTATFQLRGLPANAASTWIETYTRRATGEPCNRNWPCAGAVDVRKYGMVNRRAYPLDGRSVDLVLPLTPAYGGSTGTLAVSVVDGSGAAVPAGTVQESYAWSMATPDGVVPSQGWGISVPDGPGHFTVPSLAGDQDYVTWVYTTRGIYVVMHIKVPARGTGGVTVNLDGPMTVDLTPPPPPPPPPPPALPPTVDLQVGPQLTGLVTNRGVPAAGVPVRLTEVYADGTAAVLGTPVTGGDGRYAVPFAPAYNGVVTASALGATSVPVPSRVTVAFPRLSAARQGQRVTVRAALSPGVVTGPGRDERVQLVRIDAAGRPGAAVATGVASTRHDAAGHPQGLNDVVLSTALPRGARVAVRVLGTPLVTGAVSPALTVR